MKAITLSIAALASALLLAGCSTDKADFGNQQTRQGDENVAPMPLPLEDLDFETREFIINSPDTNLYVIRSIEDMRPHLKKTIYRVPGVDFSQNSVLLVTGTARRGIAGMERSLIRKPDGEYLFSVTVYLGMTAYAPQWSLCVKAPLIPADASVKLSFRYVNAY